MGWSIGYDPNWEIDIGYGVPAWCDHPGCKNEIDRGLSYVCGGQPYGGEVGCGLYFCESHLHHDAPVSSEEMELNPEEAVRALMNPQLCEKCSHSTDFSSFEPKQDHPKWMIFKMKDASWAEWRKTEGEKYLHLQMTRKGVKPFLTIDDIAKIYRVPADVLRQFFSGPEHIDVSAARETMIQVMNKLNERTSKDGTPKI